MDGQFDDAEDDTSVPMKFSKSFEDNEKQVLLFELHNNL